MLGWFKQKQQDSKLTRAAELGRQTARRFADDPDRLMQIRFGPVAHNFLEVIQGQYNKCLNPTNAPPLSMARVEYEVFLENVDELRGKMTGEIEATLADHMVFSDEVGARDKFDELIQKHVADYCCKLKADGLERLTDMAHALKLADDQWRAAHPALSAKFPHGLMDTVVGIIALIVAAASLSGCASSNASNASFGDPSGGLAQQAKCSQSPTGCYNEASKTCHGGPYQILDSESHAGGLVADVIPGPVTWYVMTYRCGPSDRKLATLPFRGQPYVPPANVTVLPSASPPSIPMPSPPRTTTCNTVGNSVNCTSY